MKVTYKLVNEAVNKAVNIISDVYPSFQYKEFTKIRISKARSKWGSVKINLRTKEYELTISNVFEEISDDKKANEKLLGTVIHELIHTIPGCMNHGNNFKYYAGLVNRKYPFLHIQRCTSMQEYGIQRQKKVPTYVASCSICKHVWNYYRRPKLIDCISYCDCPYCKTKTLYFSRIQGHNI